MHHIAKFYIFLIFNITVSYSLIDTDSSFNSQLPNRNSIQNKETNLIMDNNNIVLLDNIVDSSNYIVGPGDVFSVIIWGVVKKQFSISISPEGTIVIPMIGAFHISGMPLFRAKELIMKKIGEIYRTNQFSIYLEQLRSFKTYISGEVNTKGSIIVNGSTRISDVIAAAGGINEKGKRRGIEIFNEISKTTKYADIALAENSTDFSKNPYINEGDRIYVPPSKDVITISGKVIHKGIFDYTSEDKVSDIVSLAGGYSRGADSNTIFVYQYQHRFDTFTVIKINHEMSKNTKLNPNDRIVVSAHDLLIKEQYVEITGEVKNPGVYPIIEGKTLLSEIIESAGGLTPYADVTMSKIIRNNYTFPGEYLSQKFKTIPNQILYPEERNFLLSSSIEKGNALSIDLSKYSANNEYDILLEKNDTIVIPRKALYIKIIGAVNRPGIIPFSEDKDISYYIDKSGGYSKKARRSGTKLIKPDKDAELLAAHEKIEPGDLLWVPEKRYVDRIQQTKDWVLFVSAIATTLLAFFALRDQIN